MLRFDNIHAGYGKKEVLRGLSLSVERGKIVALLGGNGAGKSTTLKVGAGLLAPWSGEVLLKEKKVSGMLVHELKRMGLSYLPQGGRVFNDLTVEENIHISNASGSESDDELLFPELRKLWSSRAGFLSGGQKQMLAIQMVLQDRPDFAFLDEPTAALDQKHSERILDAIKEITSRYNTGVLLVEQNTKDAVRVSDSIRQLAGGRIV